MRVKTYAQANGWSVSVELDAPDVDEEIIEVKMANGETLLTDTTNEASVQMSNMLTMARDAAELALHGRTS